MGEVSKTNKNNKAKNHMVNNNLVKDIKGNSIQSLGGVNIEIKKSARKTIASK